VVVCAGAAVLVATLRDPEPTKATSEQASTTRAIAPKVESPREVAAPACNHAARAPRSYFRPLPDSPRVNELHHIDDFGMVDLDCDGVIDQVNRHVGVDGPELFVSSYLHRKRFVDYRIPLVSPGRPCEARVTVDEQLVEIVLTRMSGAGCDASERVEHYAIREGSLYLDGKFLRKGN